MEIEYRPPLRDVILGITELAPFSVVARRLAETALDLTDADYAALGAYEGERLVRFQSVGIGDEESSTLEHAPLGLGLLGEFARGAKAINLPSIEGDPRAKGFPSGHAAMGPFLGVAVTYGSRTIGAFYVARQVGATAFTQLEQQRIEEIVPYAAITLANAQMLETEQRRADAAELMANTARGLQDLPDEPQAAELLADAMDEFFVTASNRALTWYGSDEIPHHPRRFEDSEFTAVLDQLLASDAEAGQRDAGALVPGHEMTMQVIDLEGRGKLALAVSIEEPSTMDDVARAALKTLGEIGGVGLSATRRRRAEGAIERYQIRDGIGRDLHDDLIQSIYAIGLNLRGTHAADDRGGAALTKASADLNTVIRDLRSYIAQLSQSPEELSTAAMLATRINALLAHDDSPIAWQATIADIGDLPQGHQLERQLYLVVREAISNIERHSRARHASLSLERRGDTLHLEVSDDGVGFDRTQVPEGSVGLRSMEERVSDLGGSAVVASTPGEGTSLIATFPLSQEVSGSEPDHGN